MAKYAYKYSDEAEKTALLQQHADKFLLEDRSRIVVVDDVEGKEHYLIFSDEDPEPERTGFKELDIASITPAQVDAYIDNNVTDLASAITVLKLYGKALLLLAKKSRIT
jgi:hypothetical protein